jgi:exodeoxyribonuclease VII large subunit
MNEFTVNPSAGRHTTGGSPVVSVAQINRKIANLLKSDRALADVCVKGEISNFTNHVSTGRLYFTLKDETSLIKAVMWNTSGLEFEPEEGMNVVVRASISAYEARGEYQLTVSEMQPDGQGALYLAFLELKERLEKLGLFEQKRALPRQPKTIAVITAESGAALQDILNVLERRNPLVRVVLIPALVQGESAPSSLVQAFHKAQSTDADVIIFGRGGGSIEDLWAFNSELVARAIFESSIPTISAVGHEVDFTIADFAADLRAPTPSVAAELAVVDIGEMYDTLLALQEDLRGRTSRLISLQGERIRRKLNSRCLMNGSRICVDKSRTQCSRSLRASVSG